MQANLQNPGDLRLAEGILGHRTSDQSQLAQRDLRLGVDIGHQRLAAVMAEQRVSAWLPVNLPGWDEQAVHMQLGNDMALNVLNVAVHAERGTDSLMWQFTRDGRVSVKSAYNDLESAHGWEKACQGQPGHQNTFETRRFHPR